MAIPPWGSPPSTDKVKKSGDTMTGNLDMGTNFLIFTDPCNARWLISVTCSGVITATPYAASLYGSALYGTGTYS